MHDSSQAHVCMYVCIYVRTIGMQYYCAPMMQSVLSQVASVGNWKGRERETGLERERKWNAGVCCLYTAILVRSVTSKTVRLGFCVVPAPIPVSVLAPVPFPVLCFSSRQKELGVINVTNIFCSLFAEVSKCLLEV